MEKSRGYAHRLDLRTGLTPVWAALTDSRLLAQWCSPDASINPRPGGLFRARVDRVTELEACIDVFVPGKRLRLIYLPSAALPPAESALVDDFILESSRSGTIVRLLGSGVPADPEWDIPYLRQRTGWQAALVRLKALLESSDPMEGL
ncbi:MAG: SRPBCC family protein [Steroidobacteraceae bacterium]